MNEQESRFKLKDHLFNRERLDYLGGLFQKADARFDAKAFVRETSKAFAELELKERITHIAVKLEDYLEADFRISAKQIVAALPERLDPSRTDDDFGDFIFAPLGEFVVRNGLHDKHVSLSLKTLKEITQRFSMEYAIRAFINAHPDKTLAELTKWSKDKNYHVRRLVSEGTRPGLPWASRLSLDPTVPIGLLDTLHTDPTRYVTRSVANHLNDISKSQPELVLEALSRWQTAGKQVEAELQWMARHALRTLVKQGHVDALEFLGFATQSKIEVTGMKLTPPRLYPGEAFEVCLTLKAKRAENLVIDYEIDFAKAGGKRSRKIHKLKQIKLEPGESVTVRKRHPLRANATTFTLYPGTHFVTVQINGRPLEKLSFELLPKRQQ
jgi:3-methyladenine DNA glycosylase AlkC